MPALREDVTLFGANVLNRMEWRRDKICKDLCPEEGAMALSLGFHHKKELSPERAADSDVAIAEIRTINPLLS
jgi:hypothetical protein